MIKLRIITKFSSPVVFIAGNIVWWVGWESGQADILIHRVLNSLSLSLSEASAWVWSPGVQSPPP
jgi:hypothetical protein